MFTHKKQKQHKKCSSKQLALECRSKGGQLTGVGTRNFLANEKSEKKREKRGGGEWS